MPHGYHLHVRDTDRNRVAAVDDYQKLDLRLTFNDVSTWELQLPSDSVAAAYLTEQGAGIHITHEDGTTVLSGPVERIERKWDAKGAVLTVSGPDDTAALMYRLALPAAPTEVFSGAAYDVRTGLASTIMGQYVNVNAGPGAAVQRRIPGLTIDGADPLAGGTITGRARFEPLLDKMQELALQATPELGFRVAQDGTDLEFQVYAPADKTDAVKFSPELGNLKKYEYALSYPTATFVYVGGNGEGTARTFRSGQDTAGVVAYGRREVFRDLRSTSSTTEMDQEITEELARRGLAGSLSLEPIETETLMFPSEYGLGDTITAYVEGEAFQHVVREVAITVTPSRGYVLVPVIQTPSGPRERLYVETLLRELRERNRNLEHR